MVKKRAGIDAVASVVKSISIIFGFSVVFSFSVLFLGCTSQPQIGSYGSAHEHTDFKVYINGAAFDFSQDKYQTPEPAGGLGEDCGINGTPAHLHNNNGNMVHKHATGVTWGYFFSSLNMSLSDDCLTLDNGTSYCNNDQNKWRFFENGVEVQNLKDKEIRDLDRVLFTYGPANADVKGQIDSVTSEAINEESGGGFCRPPNT